MNMTKYEVTQREMCIEVMNFLCSAKYENEFLMRKRGSLEILNARLANVSLMRYYNMISKQTHELLLNIINEYINIIVDMEFLLHINGYDYKIIETKYSNRLKVNYQLCSNVTDIDEPNIIVIEDTNESLGSWMSDLNDWMESRDVL